MHVRLSLPLIAIAIGCAALAWGGVAVSAAVTPDQQSTMLAMHNGFRRDVATAETARLGRTVTIPGLTWNAAAASTAQAWADHLAATGAFEHNAGRGALGENLTAFESSVPFPSPNPTSVDQAFGPWRDEASSYRWDTNSCTTVCGHYTQLVWAATTSVGCGVATGGGALIPGGFRTVWVCNYAPAGNVVGDRPYEAGAPIAAPAPPPAVVPAPGAGTGEGGFVGNAPGRGVVGLLVTSRVSSAAGLVSALTAGGCPAASIAVLEAGSWKVYVVGAPAVVNTQFPASLPSGLPFFVRCA